MIITGSNINMKASHQEAKAETEQESLELYRISGDQVSTERIERASAQVSLSAEALSLSRELSSNAPRALPPQASPTAVSNQDQLANDAALEPKLKLAKGVIESLTGKRIEIGFHMEASHQEVSMSAEQTGVEGAEGELVGMHYEKVKLLHEQEQLAFSAQGSVTTADGKQINLSLVFELSRSYTSYESEQLSVGFQLKDPLVINFAGPAAELTDQKFGFDLDADGQQEQISFTQSGSGLLALDKNGDGRINDGKELFGAISGNGFADLAKYDDDGNGFIDEGDSVYNQLKIWVKDASGGDQLNSLQDSGVGAIYLGAIDTPFALKTSSNELQGEIRSSSIFLSEQGRVGTVQQVDLVV